MYFGRTDPVVFEPAESYDEALLDAVIEQIGRDLANGDASAIYDLLQNVAKQKLEGYLPEWELENIQKEWAEEEAQ